MSARKTVWLCGACGKQADEREAVGDESCYMHAVEVYADSVVRTDKGLHARAVLEHADVEAGAMTNLRVIADVRACRACSHGSTRKQAVFSRGDPLSTLCFVGEAPGAEEDEQGLPFVGDSGKLLDKQIAAMREYAAAQGVEFPASPYVCNVLKCRPPGNKLLKDGSDVAACSEHLWAQLRSLPNLRVVVALGKTAAQTLLSSEETIGKLRGKTVETMGGIETLLPAFVVVPTYHPSYLLRQPNDKALRLEVWSDLQRAVEALR